MANESNIKDELKGLFKEHDYDQLYYKQDIVTYQINGTTNFYQAIRNVPRFVPITDRRYWNLLTTGIDNSVDDESNQPTGPDYLCFTANKAGATLMLCGIIINYDGEDFALEYSTDGENWENLEITKKLINGAPSVGYTAASSILTFSSEGDKVYFRGNNTNGSCYLPFNDESGYCYIFCGDPTTNTEDNEFSVSGDLQTIVNKTGADKERGCFGSGNIGLFVNSEELMGTTGILITSAPDLTATTLIPSKYANLFGFQTLLEEPANMPNFTTNNLPSTSFGDGLGCFSAMYYGCTSLKEPADFSGLTINSVDDSNLIYTNLENIYGDTTFNITNNNGITLNGFGSISTITENYNKHGTLSVATFLGNTNGFDYITVRTYNSPPTETSLQICTINITSDEYNVEDCFYEEIQMTEHYIIGGQSGDTVTLNAYCEEGYGVEYWYKQDGNSWVPMGDAITGTLPEDRHYTKEIVLPTEDIIDCYRPSKLIVNLNLK